MYITNHRVYDWREMKKISIGIRYTGKDYGSNPNEEYFCAVDTPKVVCCATVEKTGHRMAILTELAMRPEYLGTGVEAGLVHYILYEIGLEGIDALEMGLEGWDRGTEAFAWTRDLVLEEREGMTLIKGQSPKPSAVRAG
jgi:hypothetical protein